jgi:hypothetical protein
MTDCTGSKQCPMQKVLVTHGSLIASTTVFIITVIFLKPRTDKFFEDSSGRRMGVKTNDKATSTT